QGDSNIIRRRADVKLTSYALSYNFQTPFSPLKWFSKGSSKKDAAVSTWHGAQPEKESEEQEDMLEFKAGINGKLHELRKSFTLVDEETGREFEKEVSVAQKRGLNSTQLLIF
ncbi:hypothetical protein KEM55_007212, partial [Ascosphaera atra]